MVYLLRHRSLLLLMASAILLALALAFVSGVRNGGTPSAVDHSPGTPPSRHQDPHQLPVFQPASPTVEGYKSNAERVAENATLVSEAWQALPAGARVRERIYRKDFKYPLISVRETFEPNSETPVHTSIAVATHVIVGLPEAGDTTFLKSLAGEGYIVDHGSPTSPSVIVGWDPAITGPGVLDAQLERLSVLLPEAAYIEPDFLAFAAGLPSDPRVGEQWALSPSLGSFGISASAGWDIRNDASGIVVAIIDSGADLDHPDLLPNLWANGNGYWNDYRGYDFVQNDGVPEDGHGHGTAVAGIAGARGNNNTGMAGTAWRVQLMILRVLDHKAEGTYGDIDRAIRYAADNGANVINLSVGGDDYSQTLANACAYAVNKGVVVVAASGNAGRNIDNTPFYPASYLTVIAVGGHRRTGYPNPEPYGNYGRNTVRITAPAAGVLSTSLGGNYTLHTGTSFAAPQVAGTVALLMANFPNENVPTTRERLLSNVRYSQVQSANLADYNLQMLDLERALADVNRNVAPDATYFSPRFSQSPPAARIEGGTPPFSIEWYRENTLLSVTDSLALTQAEPGNYRLRITGRNGFTELDWIVWDWAPADEELAVSLQSVGMSDVVHTIPASWTLDNDTLVSASVPVGGLSSLAATFDGVGNSGPAYLIFDWRLYAGHGDHGILFVGGEEFARLSEPDRWQTVVVPLQPGSSIEWRFSNASDAGLDHDHLEIANPRISLLSGTSPNVPMLALHPGASVTLGVPSEEPFFVRWYFNGNMLNNWAEVYSLALSNVSEADQGLYSYEVTTVDGPQSGYIFLNVLNEPEWSELPQSVEVQAGAPFSTRGLLEESTARYSWQKQGALLPESGTFLERDAASMEDIGTYTLYADTVDGQTVSTTISVTVVPGAPRILSQPWLTQGGQLTLSATGEAPLSFRYFRNGTLIHEGGSSSIAVTPGAGKDFYEVEVGNAHGSVRSETFVLHGHEGIGPVIRTQLQDFRLSRDLSASNILTADVPAGSSVSWSLNGFSLGLNTASIDVTGKPGVYYYDVVAPDGRAERSRVASVLPAPRRHRSLSQRPPSSIYLPQGVNIQAGVSLFEESPQSTSSEFLWIRDGEPTSASWSGIASQFVLENVSDADAGIYQLLQRNGSDWFASQPVDVLVNGQSSEFESLCSEEEARQVLLESAGLQVYGAQLTHQSKLIYAPCLAFNVPREALMLAPGTFYYKGWLLRPEMRPAHGGTWQPAPVDELQMPQGPFAARITAQAGHQIYACWVKFDLSSGIPLLFRLRLEQVPLW